MAVPAQPHDALFRALVDEPARADRLIREHLPPDIAALLADEPVRAVEGTFIDPGTLAASRSDRLFEARLEDGRGALLYVLLEHKSRADPDTALQMMGYMHRIWQQYAGGAAAGCARCRPSSRWCSIMVAVGGGWRVRWWRWSTPRRNWLRSCGRCRTCCAIWGGWSTRRCRVTRRCARGLGALKYVFVPELPEGVLVRMIVDIPDDHPLEPAFFRYIVTTYSMDRSELEGAARIAKPQRWEALMSTIAQEWIKTGEARGEARGEVRGRSAGLVEGEVRGEARGRAKALLQLLEARFGAVSEGVRTRVLSASPRELDTWLGAVLDARDLDAVFGGESTH